MTDVALCNPLEMSGAKRNMLPPSSGPRANKAMNHHEESIEKGKLQPDSCQVLVSVQCQTLTLKATWLYTPKG
jgi:hypothetical protein